ncbi:MAG: hypothetical protein AAGG09_21940 [Pseudomonadota bacterium]
MADAHPASSPWLTLEAGGNRLVLDPALGNLRALELDWDGRRISPLATAPWVARGEPVPEDLPPVERQLAGDFLCAPFGASDVEEAPPHGHPANSAWTLGASEGALSLVLDRSVMGASVSKRLALSPEAPLLYQVHEVSGGQGGLTLAHHPMVHMAAGGRMTVSPKRVALTTAPPLEPGRNRLLCPAESADLAQFPAAEGGTLDLGHLPIGTGTEDFVTLVEAEGRDLGWTAILRAAEDDIVFFLKDPAVLSVTMLWHSNAGRDYPPWSGRHTGVLGVEDGIAAGALGHAAALGDNPIARTGVPTHLPLAQGHTHRIAHVTGAIPRPPGWTAVAEILAAADHLRLTDISGDTCDLPFDGAFLRGES